VIAMSKKDDDKKDPITERIVRLETIVQFHEQRLNELESGLKEIKTTLEEVLQTTKGLGFFLKNIALPIAITVITAVILRMVI
jgi:uncharacterized protein (UPF0335 family)